MKCEEVQKRLSEYIDNRLEENTRSAIDAHFTICPACRNELDTLTAVIAELKTEQAIKAPDDFVFQLHKKMNSQSGLNKFFKSLFTPFGMKIPFGFATATAVAVAVLFVLQVERPDKALLPDRKTETQTTRQMENVEKPEKKPVDSPLSSDMGELPAVEPAPPPAVPQKGQPDIVLQKKTDFVKEQTGLGMAAVSEPVERKTPKTIQWVLTVSSTYVEGSGTPVLQKSKTAEYESLAGTSPGNSDMKKEEAVDVIENERSGKDKNAQRPYTPMDKALDNIETLTARLGGKVISVKQTRSPYPECFMTLTIPAAKVTEFAAELSRIGRFDGQSEGFSEFLEDPVMIHLKLMDR